MHMLHRFLTGKLRMPKKTHPLPTHQKSCEFPFSLLVGFHLESHLPRVNLALFASLLWNKANYFIAPLCLLHKVYFSLGFLLLKQEISFPSFLSHFIEVFFNLFNESAFYELSLGEKGSPFSLPTLGHIIR